MTPRLSSILLVLSTSLVLGSCQLPEWLTRRPNECNRFMLPPLDEHNGSSVKTAALALNDEDQVVGFSQEGNEILPVVWRFLRRDDLERLMQLVPNLDQGLHCPQSSGQGGWAVCVSRLPLPPGTTRGFAKDIDNPIQPSEGRVSFLAPIGPIVGSVWGHPFSQAATWNWGSPSLLSSYWPSSANGVTSGGAAVGTHTFIDSNGAQQEGWVRWRTAEPFTTTPAQVFGVSDDGGVPVAAGAIGWTPVLLRPNLVPGFGTLLETGSSMKTLGGQGQALAVTEGSSHGVVWTTAAGWVMKGGIRRPALWHTSSHPLLPFPSETPPTILQLGPDDESATPMEGEARSIRRVRQVVRAVGYYLKEGRRRAFEWNSSDGGADLEDKLQPICSRGVMRYDLSEANDINRKGHIVGTANTDRPRQRGFLLVPNVDLLIDSTNAYQFYIRKGTGTTHATKGTLVTYQFHAYHLLAQEVEATIWDILPEEVDFVSIPEEQPANDPESCVVQDSSYDPSTRRVEIQVKIKHTCRLDMIVKVNTNPSGPSPYPNNHIVRNVDYGLTVQELEIEHATHSGNFDGYFWLDWPDPPPVPVPPSIATQVRPLYEVDLSTNDPTELYAETGELVGFHFSVRFGDHDIASTSTVEIWDQLPDAADGSDQLVLDHSIAEYEPPANPVYPPPAISLPDGFCDEGGAGAWTDAGGGWLKALVHVEGSNAEACRLITKVSAVPRARRTHHILQQGVQARHRWGGVSERWNGRLLRDGRRSKYAVKYDFRAACPSS